MEDKKTIKDRIQDHLLLYSVGGVLIVAGITMVIVRGRYEALATGGAYGSKTIDTSITMRPLSFLASQINLVNVVARDGRGHPGYLVHCLNTDTYFTSQREAAERFNISPTILSKHLSGKLDNVKGMFFERVKVEA